MECSSGVVDDGSKERIERPAIIIIYGVKRELTIVSKLGSPPQRLTAKSLALVSSRCLALCR
jgi:hypothetical protein